MVGNFELVIVDDQSKDRTVEIAKSYEPKDERIKVFINEVNLGDYPNRNKAASYAKGKYLKYVDADDMIYPHGLEVLVHNMEQFPDSGYGLCSLDMDEFRKYPFELKPIEAYKRHYIDNISLFHKAPLSSIIKKTAFDTVGGFTGKQHLGDFEMWHLLSQRFQVVLMPDGIVWYRVHDDQQMNDNITDPFVPFKYLLIAEELLNSDSCPLAVDQRERAKNQVKCKIARAILSAAKLHSFKKSKELYKASGYSRVEIFKNLI
jgi:glycosyltransferase involved in cell wall biosynthesis